MRLLPVDSMIVHVISVDGGEHKVELVEVKKNLVRRSIEQLGFIKDVNSLVVLSGKLFFNLFSAFTQRCPRGHCYAIPVAIHITTNTLN